MIACDVGLVAACEGSLTDMSLPLVLVLQSSEAFVASFLASLDAFRSWAWCDVQEFAEEVEGVQVDKGMELFREGDVVNGLHILHFGEVMVERLSEAQKVCFLWVIF